MIKAPSTPTIKALTKESPGTAFEKALEIHRTSWSPIWHGISPQFEHTEYIPPT